MDAIHYLLAFAAVALAVGMPLKRAFARRSAGRVMQLEFKREHGARVRELVGGSQAPDPRRGSPWIAIEFDGDSAMLAAARLHRGRLQAGVQLLDVLLPLEIWDADPTGDGAVDVDVIPGVNAAAAEVIARQLGALGVDSLASGQLGAGMPPVLRVQFDDVEELPALLDECASLVRALVALTPASGAIID